MQAGDDSSESFLKWFKSVGATLNEAVGITNLPGMSRGAIALQDIEKDTVLFTIPRKALLSIKTSSLRRSLGEEDWNALGNGWQPLILSMMWEESRGKDSYWSGYLEDLPESFDTLMFWNDEELDALQGSTIRDKIGKADAEKDYYERVLPIIQRRRDIFDPSHLQKYFSIERYHINGNRILSRSFQVEEWQGNDEDNEEGQEQNADRNQEDLMQTDPDPQNAHEHGPDDEEINADAGHEEAAENEDGDDDDSERAEDIAMVPMADILNARYGCNNARLFYEKDYLQMISTQIIKSREQIWNTYGDLPNAELLRRYGHVDVIPISKEQNARQPQSNVFPFENPADEVELRADLVAEVCLLDVSDSDKIDKIEVWLQLGGEDIFAIDKDELTPKPMLSMIRYLSMNREEVQEIVEKEKLPKGKTNAETLQKVIEILERRLRQYQTSVQNDELFLSHFKGLPNRLYFATFVRLGEKRLLEQALKTAQSALQQEKAPAKNELKRRRNDEESQSRKKTKR